MKEIYCVEIDRYDPLALAHVLEKMGKAIPDFEYEWQLKANGGGIDYGLYINVDINRKEIEICNQPEDGEGEDWLEDIFENFKEEDEDEDEEED